MGEWDTIASFIFYICPCTALSFWLADRMNIGLWVLVYGLGTLFFCTILVHVMNHDSTPIDDTLKQLKDIKEQKSLEDF
jgi:hypothetical protein